MRTVDVLAIFALAGVACAAPATITATPTASAAASSSASPVALTSSPTVTAAVVTPTTANSTVSARDNISSTGTVVSIDLAKSTFVLFVASAQNPAVSNQNVAFRIDGTTKLQILGGKTATNLADFGLQVGERVGIGFLVSSYDPASKTFLMGIVQRTAPH